MLIGIAIAIYSFAVAFNVLFRFERVEVGDMAAEQGCSKVTGLLILKFHCKIGIAVLCDNC